MVRTCKHISKIMHLFLKDVTPNRNTPRNDTKKRYVRCDVTYDFYDVFLQQSFFVRSFSKRYWSLTSSMAAIRSENFLVNTRDNWALVSSNCEASYCLIIPCKVSSDASWRNFFYVLSFSQPKGE